MSEQATFDARSARAWLGLAVGSLLIAGLFAVVLVVGRMPPFVSWVTDPLFFKRCLVVHVDLALVLWFYAFVCSLHFLLPVERSQRWLSYIGIRVAMVGMILLISAVCVRGVQPVLANYVPVLDHPFFLWGLAAFGAGISLCLVDGRLLPGGEAQEGALRLPAAARPGVRAAGVAFLLAMITFLVGALTTPSWLPTQSYFEQIMWGGGHVLQFASAIAMVTVWLILLTPLVGELISRRSSAILFGLLILPLLGAPVLAGRGAEARTDFTALMRWGIFPVVTIFLVACLRAVWRAQREGRLERWDPRFTGFAISAALTVLGFGLGAMIRGSNTIVPAHYHASIGAVTVSFMAVSFVLIEPLGLRLPEGRLRRWAAWQPLLFGCGQMIFAGGFAVAGAYGAARKAYGAEQTIRSSGEWTGLVVMGLGGLVAVAGGVLFLVIMGFAWRHRVRGVTPREEGRSSWSKALIPTMPTRSS